MPCIFALYGCLSTWLCRFVAVVLTTSQARCRGLIEQGGAMQLSGRGVALSIIASVLFAVVPGYVRLLAPLDGLQVFAQRVLWSMPAVLLLPPARGRGGVLPPPWGGGGGEPLLLASLPLAALLIGIQWALFVW